MRKIKPTWIILLFAGMVCGEMFEITSYSPEKGMVGIRSGSVCTNRLFSSFSPDDQQKITGWLVPKAFEDDSVLSVDIDKEERSEVVDRHDRGEFRTDGKLKTTTQFNITGTQDIISFTITLQNHSKIVLFNMIMEYQLFYETDDGGNKAKKMESGRVQIAELRSECIQTNKTKEIVLRDETAEAYEVSFSGRDKNSKAVKYLPGFKNKDRFEGLYVCVSMPDGVGDRIKREYKIGRVPDKEDWDEYKNSVEQDKLRFPPPNQRKTAMPGSLK